MDAVLKWRPKRRFESPRGSPSRNGSLPLLSGKAVAVRSDAMSDLRFAVITTIIIVLTYVVAMTVSSLEAVLAYVGSTGSTSISFILPGLFYYKISSPDSPHHQRLMKETDDSEEESAQEDHYSLMGLRAKAQAQLKKGLLRRLSLGLAIYGLIVMVTCLIMNTRFLVTSH